ncbi:MAG: hypothetical protein RIS92_1255 [Verrucomicrobiota bacterium]|jgi:phosphoribosylaminoimidazole-succinocarboxamide synthase
MTLHTPDLKGLKKVASGKVREIYDLGEWLLMVTSDRISAFDCILPDPVPLKGQVLTGLSAFWFGRMDFVENHLVTTDVDAFPPAAAEQVAAYREVLRGRTMLVRKAKPLAVECVVRGYLAGSGWKEYQASGTLCSHPLPAGLHQASPLPEVMFTPSTKAQSGHDENISWEQCCEILGEDLAREVRDLSIRIYTHGRDHAEQNGIILADTKFEFGIYEGRVILIDEVMTPDSSRFWPKAEYRVGMSPPSFDKQYVRDYLESLDWDKTPPAPALPEEVIQGTTRRYLEAYEQITGTKLAGS